MRLTPKGLWIALLASILADIAALSAILEVTDLAILSAFVASLLTIFLGQTLTGSYSNLTVVFLAFGSLYGISGPVAAYYGEGLPRIFPTPYAVNEFIFHYSLALMGFLIGLVIIACGPVPRRAITMDKLPAWNGRMLFPLAHAFIAMASFAELVNFVRVGGLETFVAGKAVYQSAVSELTGTLPSVQVALLAAAFLGFALSNPRVSDKTKLRQIGLWILLGLPLLVILTFLGRRGPLLSIIIIFLVSYSFFKPLRRISFKWIAAGISIYLIFAFLFGARAHLGYVLVTGDWSALATQVSKREFWVTILNPASNEFGAPFGNFSTHILLRKLDEPRLGETYLQGLTIPIPRWIWPDKPRSITYEFRDTYFPEESDRGTIAGTAFSSILEAYINFGTVGVPIVYFFVALSIGVMERVRSYSRSLMFALFYVTLLPEAIFFHRSSLEMPIFWPLVLSLGGYCSYKCLRAIGRKCSRFSNN